MFQSLSGLRRKLITFGLVGMACLSASFLAAEPAWAASAPAQSVSDDDIQAYESRHGYTILCPKKPQVIPASIFFEGENKKGDVLVFDGYYNDVTHTFVTRNAWAILVDDFDTKDVPDFNKISEQEAETYLEKLMHTNPFEGVSLINLTPTNKAVLANTAKEIEIDENGDGQDVDTAVAETQQAVVFFRTPDGRCFTARLIDNPVLREQAVKDFLVGVASIMSKGTQDAVAGSASTSDKQKASNSKDKKTKKDKKK